MIAVIVVQNSCHDTVKTNLVKLGETEHTMPATAKASSSWSPRRPPIFSRANSRTKRKSMPIPYSVKVSTVKASADMVKIQNNDNVRS